MAPPGGSGSKFIQSQFSVQNISKSNASGTRIPGAPRAKKVVLQHVLDQEFQDFTFSAQGHENHFKHTVSRPICDICSGVPSGFSATQRCPVTRAVIFSLKIQG